MIGQTFKHFTVFLLCAAGLAGTAFAQEPRTYKDAQGRDVHFPLGALSFADELASFTMGNPAPASAPARNRDNILAEPDGSSLSLGCSGVATLRFSDNALVDIEGPDLYVFEIGSEVEATHLEISEDGRNWIDAGPIEGATAEIDIAGIAGGTGRIFHYVRLTDRNIDCRAGNYSGADIDAVGAIGAAILVSLSGEVLFDFDSHELRREAWPELDRVLALLQNYPGAQVVVEGHTDARGSDAYNENLSRERAISVKAYFNVVGKVPLETVETRGSGERRPVATNETDEGRQKNRRVEIIIIPAA